MGGSMSFFNIWPGTENPPSTNGEPTTPPVAEIATNEVEYDSYEETIDDSAPDGMNGVTQPPGDGPIQKSLVHSDNVATSEAINLSASMSSESFDERYPFQEGEVPEVDETNQPEPGGTMNALNTDNNMVVETSDAKSSSGPVKRHNLRFGKTKIAKTKKDMKRHSSPRLQETPKRRKFDVSAESSGTTLDG